MEISLSHQAYTFIISVITGAAISIIYDLFRIIRCAFYHGVILTFIEDILFSFISLCVCVAFLNIYNDGIFRLYLAIGTILGFTICHFTVGQILIFQAKFIIKTIKWILWLIFYPIRLILKIFCKFFKKIALFLKKPFIFCIKRVIILKSYVKKSKGGIRTGGKNKKKKLKSFHKNSSYVSNRIPFIHFYRHTNQDKQ